MGRVVVERALECSSSVEQLWPLVADTERMNRAAGLHVLELDEQEKGSAARYTVKTVRGGLPVQYDEYPFEFVKYECLSVRRVTTKGVIEYIDTKFMFEPTPTGSKVTIRVEAVPKLWGISAIVRWEMYKAVGNLLAQVKRDDEAIAKGLLDGSEGVRFSQCAPTELERAMGLLVPEVGPQRRDIAKRLVQYVQFASDLELDRMRPFELAEQWKEPRRDVLAVCLHATVCGLLELRWDLVCPSCHTAASREESLSGIGESGRCHLCDLNFGISLDRAVEATFRPHRSVRQIHEGRYCTGGPSRTPHVLTQVIVPVDSSATIAVPVREGKYRLFARGGNQCVVRVQSGQGASLNVHIDEPLSDLLVAPSGQLVLHNQSAREVHAKLELVVVDRNAANVHELSTVPEFRRLLGSQLLRPGLTLRIGRTPLLFTDLTGSTAMYSRLGDARAFGVVQQHFELLQQVVEEHQGAIVKTIGDAIMAAFASDEQAVCCALAMHRAMPEFRARHPDAAGLRLTIGAFSGPSYSVTANGILDYFGQSVNIAARLQGKAGPGELVMTAQQATGAEESGWLKGAEIRERFATELKGLPEPLQLCRVVVDAPQELRKELTA